MKARLARCFALAALLTGLAGIASGLAILIAAADFGLAEMGFGLVLVIVGLGSWFAGVWLAKSDYAARHMRKFLWL